MRIPINLSSGLLIILIIFISCDLTDTPDPDESMIQPNRERATLPKEPDPSGNLVIINRINENLLLYESQNPIREIPALTDSFLIHIEQPFNRASNLKLYLANDVYDLESPPNSALIRRWEVPLAENDAKPTRATWLVQSSEESYDGTVYLYYPDSTDYGLSALYNVDVFEGAKTGSKVASLSPGTQNKKAGLSYGIHYLYFLYWYSNPNDNSGRSNIDWKDEDDEGNNFIVSLNAILDSVHVDIPILRTPAYRLGEMHIYNSSDNLIQVYANSRLIEEIVVTDDNRQNLSIIPPGYDYAFLLPEANYNFVIQSPPNSSNDIEYLLDIDVVELHRVQWIVGDTFVNENVLVDNQCNEPVTIHSFDPNTQTEGYLGYLMNTNETRSIEISSTLHALKAWNLSLDKSLLLYPIENNWIIDVLNEE
ncbi:hypothetical protein K8I28_05580 [bacterium]|nr:hypothetical protein [bacterium]